MDRIHSVRAIVVECYVAIAYPVIAYHLAAQDA